MSLIRVTVVNHLEKSRLTIRELLEAAYFKKYGKPIPGKYLEEQAFKWERGQDDINYLYDFMFATAT